MKMKKLKNIYQPITEDLCRVEDLLRSHLNTKYNSLCRINDYLLGWGGKRLRPALVMLSAHAAANGKLKSKDLSLLIRMAAAIELIHTASLIHDDIIDNSLTRRNKQTIHAKWGEDVSIAFGDYIYTKAFELVAKCGHPDVLGCVAVAARAMCEGQLFQIFERDNFDLPQKEYMVIVNKKTAALISACCKGAALIAGNHDKEKYTALNNYGVNFGIAFQVVDDYLDIIAAKSILGKSGGQDIAQGEITLPLYDLFNSLAAKDRKELKEHLAKRNISKEIMDKIKDKIKDSAIFIKTKEEALSSINKSKHSLGKLSRSSYRDALGDLADYVIERGFGACL
ncbi:MAG TPA: polyprenyl synthetase family protein [Candidatus Omnitrophica bacterium]|nr:polyprenyl synthetase family protein [Candidatus Omnitrophota bacterium]